MSLMAFINCDNEDNPLSVADIVNWMEMPTEQITEKMKDYDMATIYNIEWVSRGEKANWPNTDNYIEPTKTGYIFAGWDFDWQNTPITGNTDIHALWTPEHEDPTGCIQPVDNYGSEHPLDDIPAEESTELDSILCSFDNVIAEPQVDWITVSKIKYEDNESTNFTGGIIYKIAANPSTESRTGLVKITTISPEIADPDKWADRGADGVATFCDEGYTYIIQNGATPTDAGFDSLVTAFRNYVDIPENGTTYNYLKVVYDEAEKQFDSGGSNNGLPNLYKQSNFPYIYNYYGSNVDEERAFKSMTGWLFAMVLSEIKPSRHNDFYKLGYEYGGYNKDSNIYGYTFHSDPNVARLVASAIYCAMRGKKKPDTRAMREEVGGTRFPNTVGYYHETDDIEYNVGNNDFFTDLTKFMPTAPGPYLSSYSDRSGIGGYPYPNEDKRNDHNLTMDRNIYDYVVENYNLDTSTGEFLQRTVQAIADKDWSRYHLFGASVTTSNGYTFKSVFNSDVLGKMVTADECPNIASLVRDSKYIGSNARHILQNGEYYGRIRPGQGDADGKRHSTTNDHKNILCDFVIENEDGGAQGYYGTDNRWHIYGHADWDDTNYCDKSKDYIFANSYPSGHSSGIWGAAMILMELFPEKADKILEAANNFAVNRTIARFHWNSDTINGRVLGTTVGPAIRAIEAFDSAFAAAKNEI